MILYAPLSQEYACKTYITELDWQYCVTFHDLKNMCIESINLTLSKYFTSAQTNLKYALCDGFVTVLKHIELSLLT